MVFPRISGLALKIKEGSGRIKKECRSLLLISIFHHFRVESDSDILKIKIHVIQLDRGIDPSGTTDGSREADSTAPTKYSYMHGTIIHSIFKLLTALFTAAKP